MRYKLTSKKNKNTVYRLSVDSCMISDYVQVSFFNKYNILYDVKYKLKRHVDASIKDASKKFHIESV